MRLIRRAVILTLLAGLTLTAQAEVLVDNGYAGMGSSATVAGTNHFLGGWERYQSFTVPDPAGWNVTDIGLWTALVTDSAAAGMIGYIYPDDGSGMPDQSNVLAQETWTMTGVIWSPTQDIVSYNVFLPQGTYWFGGVPADADYEAKWYFGTAGEVPGLVYRYSDGVWADESNPLSLRIEGTVAPEPGTSGLLLLAAGFCMRRRR
jgi:hypothetical protein